MGSSVHCVVYLIIAKKEKRIFFIFYFMRERRKIKILLLIWAIWVGDDFFFLILLLLLFYLASLSLFISGCTDMTCKKLNVRDEHVLFFFFLLVGTFLFLNSKRVFGRRIWVMLFGIFDIRVGKKVFKNVCNVV